MEWFWGLFILLLCIVGFLAPVRRVLLMPWIISIFKGRLPSISDTEQVAIDAGDVWWEGTLFSGKPDWQSFHQWKSGYLSPAEQQFLDTQVTQLCSMLDDWQYTHTLEDLAPKVWDYLKNEGFFGMIIPKSYGGLGFSALLHSEVITRIAARSFSAAVTTMVPNSLGPAELLLHYGTEAQKQYYLPRLARGLEIPCFALTSHEAGSDAGSITDTGIIVKSLVNGQEILMISLTWEKRYITLAPVATVLGLAFKLYDPDHLLSDQTELGITLGLVPTHHPGVEMGRRHYPLNAVFMNGPSRGKNVLIPMDWIIGGPEYIGKGWRMLMDCLSAGRGISLPALSAGIGAVCFRGTGAYAFVRRQFKLPIGHFEGVAQSLARIGCYQYALNAVRLFTIMGIDQGKKPAVASAIAKYHMTEWARVAINDAMDIHGGKGIMLGPKNYLGRLYQAIPISITVEGANILTRNLIIFGQGAIRCHPYVLQEIAALKISDRNEQLKAFDKAFSAHMCHCFRNLILAFWFGCTRGRFIRTPPVVLKSVYQKVTWMSTVLAILAEVAMVILGGSLKKRESLAARLGDLLSFLYFLTAILHYFWQHGQTEEEKPYVTWNAQKLLWDMEQAAISFCYNFPVKWLGRLLRWILFPLGSGFLLPKDSETFAIAASMQTLSPLRDRLSHYASIPFVEEAFAQMYATEPLMKKVYALKQRDFEQALAIALQSGLLNENEVVQLRARQEAYLRAIQVDEF